MMSDSAHVYIAGIDMGPLRIEGDDGPPDEFAIPPVVSATAEFTCTTDEDFAALIGIAREPGLPATARMRSDLGRLFVEVDVELPAERDWATGVREVSFSMPIQRGGLAAIGCTRCGLSRRYANVKRLGKATARWKRHVCARGSE